MGLVLSLPKVLYRMSMLVLRTQGGIATRRLLLKVLFIADKVRACSSSMSELQLCWPTPDEHAPAEGTLQSGHSGQTEATRSKTSLRMVELHSVEGRKRVDKKRQ